MKKSISRIIGVIMLIIAMKKFFLPVYTILVFSIVIWFALYGEHRDPRFYVSILILAIVGKFIASHIDKEK